MTTQVSEKLFPNLSKSGMPALPGLYLPIISPASPKMPYKIPLPLFLILRLLCRSEPLRSLDISPSSLLLHAKDFIYVPRSNSIPTFTSSPCSPNLSESRGCLPCQAVAYWGYSSIGFISFFIFFRMISFAITATVTKISITMP